MVYSYLLDLYRLLAKREQELKTLQEQPGLTLEDAELLRGRLTALRDFDSFLRDNFHAKLPKRLQKN